MSTNNPHYNFHKIIIIGCGPSSLSAAIQLIRADISFLMIAEEMGGLIRNANLIENLLGFPNGISGKEMVSIMQETIEKYQVPVIYTKVIEVTKDKEHFWINTHRLTFSCEYLIIGTGTIPNKLKIPGEEEATSSNLLFYDVFKFKDDREGLKIGIIGSGDAAYDYALNLATTSNSIEILQRGAQSKALPLLIRRVDDKANIKINSNTSVQKIEIEENQLKLGLESEQGLFSKSFDVVFVTIGRSPNISFLSPDLKELFWKESESNKINEKIWFIGDVKNQKYRQLAIAMADGIRTAMEITAMFHK